ncbi:MAG: LysR family transcriptional regulator [Erysipelotrichaceae bacterium]|nr:LysR family transcriptional regulator [Erysipelotrichaceae bacterium]
MNLRHLQIFIKVYETKSMSQAAKELYIAQPSISLAIKEIEEHYNTKLFDRISKHLYPTESAHTYYQYAKHVIDLYDEMEESMMNNESMELKIGSSITIGNYILPDILKLFKSQYPDAQFHIIINNSQYIEQAIYQNDIDLALIETDPMSNDIIKIPFMKDHLYTIASPNHPLTQKEHPTLEDIKDENFIMREEGSSVYKLVNSIFVSHQLNINPSWQSTSSQAIIRAVENNLGISTLPYLLIRPALDDKRITTIPIEELHIERNYHIIYHKNKYLTSLALKFIETCQTYEKSI